jgi:CRP-like cAMP-binding protein
MRGRRRLLSVHASEDSELIAISRVDFLDLLESHPSLVRSFSRILAAQILAAAAQAPVGTRAA